ncbi:MAG: hypothetical protein P8Y03_29970, partial [Anaerolineales bacterium]
VRPSLPLQRHHHAQPQRLNQPPGLINVRGMSPSQRPERSLAEPQSKETFNFQPSTFNPVPHDEGLLPLSR